MLAPVAALAITVFFATGEVRYRIPFDVFLMVVVVRVGFWRPAAPGPGSR